MKKLISCTLVICILLSLCACGKSTEVKVAEWCINDIGEVTVDSLEKIESAEMMYNALTEAEKKKVENYDILADARKTFDTLTEGMAQLESVNAYLSLNLAYAAALEIADHLTGVNVLSDERLIARYELFATKMAEGLDMVHAIEDRYGSNPYTSTLKYYYSSIRRLTNFMDTITAETPDPAGTIDGYVIEIDAYQKDLKWMLELE